MPSSQMTPPTPGRLTMSRSMRETADGPPANGVAGAYSAGPATWLPPIPSLTTTRRSPKAAWRRRASTSGQRSSPLRVDAVPSVIESPKATSTLVPAGALISSSSRKYHDVVEKGNAPSPSSPPRGPASGALRYELVRALACHVTGPLSPATWKLTASLRPLRSGSPGEPTNPSLRVADDASSRRHDDAGVAPEGRGGVGPGHDRAAALLQPDERAVERHGPRPEGVGEADTGLPSPDVRPHDHPERLVAGPPFGRGKGEPELRLCRGIAHRVGAVGGCRPAGHEPVRGRRRGARRGQHGESDHELSQ